MHRLFESIKQGDVEEILSVFASEAVDAINVNGYEDDHTLLHVACQQGLLNTVKALLMFGADRTLPHRSTQDTALHITCFGFHNRVGVATMLLDAPPKTCTKMLAARNEHGLTALHAAAAHGDAELVQLLLERGADPHARDSDGSTPLHLSARGGHDAAVEKLVVAGADVNAANELRMTALHEAAGHGHGSTVNCLLAHNADSQYKGLFSDTPLHTAANNNQMDIVTALVTHDKACLDVLNDYGESAIHRTSSVDVVDLFLSFGVPVDSIDSDRSTPLHHACEYGQIDMVEFLLDRGANIHAQDKFGNTPFHISCFYGHLEIIALIMQVCDPCPEEDSDSPFYPLPKDVHVANIYGDTPLHLASFAGQLDVVQLIFRAGVESNEADLKALNDDGLTPVDVVHWDQGEELLNIFAEEMWRRKRRERRKRHERRQAEAEARRQAQLKAAREAEAAARAHAQEAERVAESKAKETAAAAAAAAATATVPARAGGEEVSPRRRQTRKEVMESILEESKQKKQEGAASDGSDASTPPAEAAADHKETNTSGTKRLLHPIAVKWKKAPYVALTGKSTSAPTVLTTNTQSMLHMRLTGRRPIDPVRSRSRSDVEAFRQQMEEATFLLEKERILHIGDADVDETTDAEWENQSSPVGRKSSIRRMAKVGRMWNSEQGDRWLADMRRAVTEVESQEQEQKKAAGGGDGGDAVEPTKAQ